MKEIPLTRRVFVQPLILLLSAFLTIGNPAYSFCRYDLQHINRWSNLLGMRVHVDAEVYHLARQISLSSDGTQLGSLFVPLIHSFSCPCGNTRHEFHDDFVRTGAKPFASRHVFERITETNSSSGIESLYIEHYVYGSQRQFSTLVCSGKDDICNDAALWMRTPLV